MFFWFKVPFFKQPAQNRVRLLQYGYSATKENCLNGRRTVWEDPFKPGRDGSQGLAQVIEYNSPLSLVVLCLGTNDFQCTHDHRAWLSAQGTAKLVQILSSKQNHTHSHSRNKRRTFFFWSRVFFAPKDHSPGAHRAGNASARDPGRCPAKDPGASGADPPQVSWGGTQRPWLCYGLKGHLSFLKDVPP